ncbi:primosomal protein N' [Denitratisoma oestradiolicum]|uniref:Replication restart protein PriA n=1 Tax=Denitratisoma oestradiolicum TaxID=311182 RepID=A0A6S6YDR1_9PROT|nr:primosomal protein N' [Denitratisoma oestradiolicum]TWO81812.1 primosomal protein N' [Denitratisoma oestradiolicum]CAB1370776.1 Primosomal protein N' [Denitratisoma oestradiolicum]
MSIVRVALDVPLPRLFDYRAEDPAGDWVGRLVRVPFGSGEKLGLILQVLDQSDQPPEKLRPIHSLLTELPPLPADWIALCEFCARYYQHPLGEVSSFALPPLLRRGKLPKRRLARPQPGRGDQEASPPLTTEQQVALMAIGQTRGFEAFLLHGVTGSGKTEVYLRAIEAVLAQGCQALMLVPEIALTPQLEGRVAARFPDAHIVSAHSGVADAARARGFLEAFEGQADIVLGTRLSVFMPLPRLGLIVVDEEHDASFKQQDGLRYSARDVAIFRAKQRDVPILLGSATPSLETFHHARTGRYRLLTLTLRAVAAAMPDVRIVDTRREKLQDGMSQALIAALELRLARGEQSLIFLNRRGYAPVLACTACGWISHCRRCAANLVVHLADRRLRCHHCGLETGIPQACPDCGNLDIHPFGRGTQRLEVALQERFPEARVLRVDRDSASSPKKWQALLAQIHAGEADILVGTQMLAKGHDFPKLTLVGVVGADAALFAADFRAPERLFAQLMQVGGRSGRALLPGEVLIQSEYPDHPLYQALADHDYSRFASQQLHEREQAGFPPFAHQALLRAEAPSVDQSLAFLAAARVEALKLAGEAVMLYDPVPMRMVRRMSLERAQLLVESASRPALQAFLATWSQLLYELKTPRELRWHLDVDPQEL